MKKLLLPVYALLCCLLLVGCSSAFTDENSGETIRIDIQNEVPDQLKSVAVSFYRGDEILGTQAMQNADGSLLAREKISFELTEDDISDGDLNGITLSVSVTDLRGESYDVSELSLLPEWGEQYSFLLRYEDGCYSLYAETDEGEEAHADAADEDAAGPYSAVINDYATAITEGWDAARMEGKGLGHLIPDCLAQDERATVGYYEGDLNGDGQPELAIAARSESEYYTGMIFALYILDDGKPSMLVKSGERDRWYYAGSGRLYNIGSSGAANSVNQICAIDRDLTYLDGVEYNGTDYPDDPWLHYTGETWEHVSADEAAAFISDMGAAVKNMEITPF